MAPSQIYCLSCLTTRTTGLWLSPDEIEWKYADIPVEESLPLMAIRKGAASFTGLLMAGYELEADILVSEILKNMTFFGHTLGEAVREARNTITATAKSSLMIMGSEARGNYQQTKYYSQITVNEAEIYGDPSIKLPLHKKSTEKYIDCEDEENIKKISINIPEEVWKEREIPVTGKSREAYHTSSYRTLYPETPYSVLAGSLPVERDKKTHIAKESISYYNFKIKVDLPPETAIEYIELKEVELLDAFSFEGKKLDLSYLNGFEIFGKARFSTGHFQPVKEVDIRFNWPFSLEKGKDCEILWFFIPSATVMENPGIIARLKSAKFSVHYSKGNKLTGQINSAGNIPVDGILTFRGPGGKIRQTDTDTEGYYSITLPSGKYWLTIESDCHMNYSEELVITEDCEKNFKIKLRKSHPISVKICDSLNSEPVAGAIIRCSIPLWSER